MIDFQPVVPGTPTIWLLWPQQQGTLRQFNRTGFTVRCLQLYMEEKQGANALIHAFSPSGKSMQVSETQLYEELFVKGMDLIHLFLLSRWLCKNHWRKRSNSSFKTLHGPT